MSGSPEHRFNFIYAELVREPDDIVGLLAYGIYKLEKIKYVEKFTSDSGRPPEPSELCDFHRQSMVRVEQYREMAESRMSEFQQSMFDEIISNMNELYDQKLKDQLHCARTPWLSSVVQSALGSALFAVFIGCIVVTILGLRYGISGIINEGMKMLSGQ